MVDEEKEQPAEKKPGNPGCGGCLAVLGVAIAIGLVFGIYLAITGDQGSDEWKVQQELIEDCIDALVDDYGWTKSEGNLLKFQMRGATDIKDPRRVEFYDTCKSARR